MKKIFISLFIIIFAVIILMCLEKGLGMLDFSYFSEVSDTDLHRYSNYYFDLLSDEEKKIYVKLAEAIEKQDENVNIFNMQENDINKMAYNVLTAYIYDNPEVFYLSNSYTILTRGVFNIEFNTIKLDYKDKQNIEQNKKSFNESIDSFLSGLIRPSKTDYEKELAIHDKLVNTVNYYEYEDIDKIPSNKHTAYGALVEKEAVCDGYAKALKILLDRADIDNIVISGELEDVPHAWNMVKLDHEYYHVDATSDDITTNNIKYVIHTYFNVSDSIIKKTHIPDNDFELPTANSSIYDYYVYNNFVVQKNDSLKTRLKDIVSRTKNNGVLEFRVNGKYTSNDIIDVLYDINYNKWKSKMISNITYNLIDNVYIFK